MSTGEETRAESNVNVLREPLTLPCGKVVPNRLVKAAMYEALTSFGGGPPNEQHFRLYEAWSKGGWGMVVTGNLFVDPRYQGLGQDMIVLPRSKWDAYRVLARCAKGPNPGPSSPLTLVQINHAGRQSIRGNARAPWSPALAPSAIPMDSKEGLIATFAYRVVYGIPKAMTQAEIDLVVKQFTEAALMAHETGWDGVELHCAHGYLLSTFLSPRTNHRTDAYGGSTRARLKIVLDIIAAIRAAVPSSFCVGMKINCRDVSMGGLSEDDVLEQVRLLHEHGGVDYINMSGGTYEEVGKSCGLSKRLAWLIYSKAFFEESDKPFFERSAAAASSLLANDPKAPRIMLTGGLRSRARCSEVIHHNAAQLCGIARPAAVDPNFATKLLDERVPDSEAVAPSYDIKAGSIFDVIPVKIIGASTVSMYHSFMLARIGRRQKIAIGTGFWPLTFWHLVYSRDFWRMLAFVVGLAVLGRRVARKDSSK